MFKNLFLILISLLFSVSAFSQIENRKYIKGKVNVPASEDPENISVYNKNSNKGTVTDDFGNFQIFAAVNDTLIISSVQYADFNAVVDKEVFDNKTMTIYLRENISILDEVVVRPYDLTGNLQEDAKNIKTLTIQPISKSSSSIVYGYTGNQRYAADSQTSPEKAIMDQSYFRYGLDLVNALKLLVNPKPYSDTRFQKNSKIQKDGNLREIYSNEFFKTYLDIPEGSINEYVVFVQEHGLDDDLLKKEKNGIYSIFD